MSEDVNVHTEPAPHPEPAAPPLPEGDAALAATGEAAPAPPPEHPEPVPAPPEAAAEPAHEPEAPQYVQAKAEAPAEPPAAEEEAAEEAGAGPDGAADAAKDEEHKKHWYVVKVQSGREDTIKEAIERRMRKEGLEEYFGQIVIPVEKYQEIKQDKNGRRVTRTKERKLYPGYLMVEVEYNDRILYLFRETSGVGDFVGAHPGDLTRAPTPMTDNEIKRILGPAGGKPGGQEEPLSPVPKWLHDGERVRVVDGTFNGMEGVVKQILDSVSKVQVELTIFGRPVPVELEFYQVEQL
jgi:transcriptional antiterminator NusG